MTKFRFAFAYGYYYYYRGSNSGLCCKEKLGQDMR